MANPNSYLLVDATAGICLSKGGVVGDNVYLYVLIIGVPKATEGGDHFLTFGYVLCSNQHAVNLEMLFGELFGRMRRLRNGNAVTFHHVTIDNDAALRSAIAKLVIGLSTKEYLRRASEIVTGKCTAAEIRDFVPILGCIAHYIRSDYQYCVKYNVLKSQKLLHLRCTSELMATTSTAVHQFLLMNYVTLLSHRYMTKTAQKALACVAQACGFDEKSRESEEEFLEQCYKNSASPDLVSLALLFFKFKKSLHDMNFQRLRVFESVCELIDSV